MILALQSWVLSTGPLSTHDIPKINPKSLDVLNGETKIRQFIFFCFVENTFSGIIRVDRVTHTAQHPDNLRVITALAVKLDVFNSWKPSAVIVHLKSYSPKVPAYVQATTTHGYGS